MRKLQWTEAPGRSCKRMPTEEEATGGGDPGEWLEDAPSKGGNLRIKRRLRV